MEKERQMLLPVEEEQQQNIVKKEEEKSLINCVTKSVLNAFGIQPLIK